jgi:hypothetical protein
VILQKIFAVVFVVFLTACSGPRLPFEKDVPAESAMVNPPWEALVKAGPGADKELDLETLNGPGGQFASAAAPPPPAEPVPDQLAVAAPPAAKPESREPQKPGIVIKAVAVPSVQGATGKGNVELTSAMRQVLRDAGWTVVNGPAPYALTIQGRVKTGAANGPTQTVKLEWVVTAPDGKRLGDVAQANDVAAGSLAQGWGENARMASEAAATGIFKLIQQYR